MSESSEYTPTILVAKGTPPKDWKEPTQFTTVEVDGQSFVVEPGVTRIDAGHPLAKARPDLFESVNKPTASRPRRRPTK